MYKIVDEHWILNESTRDSFHSGSGKLYKEFLDWCQINEPDYDSENFELEEKKEQRVVGYDEDKCEAIIEEFSIYFVSRKVREEEAEELRFIREQRKIRNELLSDTDYTQIADAPLTSQEKQEYREYRKYLRLYPKLWKHRMLKTETVMTKKDWEKDKPIIPAEWKN